MALSPEDRIFVADRIEQSLSTSGFASPEIAAAWTSEIERRVQGFDRGELTTADVQGALEHIRRRLAEHRAHKGAS